MSTAFLRTAVAKLTDVDPSTIADRRVAVWHGDTTSGRMAFRDAGGFWIDDYVPAGATLDRTGVTSGNPAGTNRAALNAAYLAASVAGGTVRLGGGTFDFSSVGTPVKTHALDIQPGHTAWVTIEGEGPLATTHKQTAGTWGFAHAATLDPSGATIADGSTFQMIRIRNLGIDHQNVANGFAGGALFDVTGKYNVDRVTIEDFATLNMGVPLVNGNNRIINILPTTQAGVLNGAIRYTVDRIAIRRGKMTAGGGGNTGIFVGAYVNDPLGQKVPTQLYKTPMVANAIVYRVDVEDCEWDSGSNPTAFRTASGIQFGQDALCVGPIRVKRSSFQRSWDVNGEFDSCLDLTIEDTLFADAWSEDVFITTWGGGGNTTDGLLEHGVNRFIRCRTRRTSAGAASTAVNLGYGFAICSKGGIQPPSVEIEKHVFERWGAESTKQGGSPIYLNSAPRRVVLRDITVLDEQPADSISTAQFNRTLVVVQAVGGKTHLMVDGFHWERVDDQVTLTSNNALRTWWGINVAVGTDLTFDIKNVTHRFNVASYTGAFTNPSVKVRAVSASLASGTGANNVQSGSITEQFTQAGVLTGQYDLITGPAFNQAGGVVAVTGGADVTQETLYRWICAASQAYYDEVIGRAVDATLQAEFTPGAALASAGVGMQNEIVIKETPDGLNKLIAVEGVDGTGANPYLRLDKVINGVRSTVQTQTPTTAPAVATKHTLRGGISGNVVTIDLYAGTQGALATSATGNDHMAVTLDAATAAILGDGILGWCGFGGIPADPGWVVDNTHYYRRGVMRGTWHSIHPKRTQNVAEALGLYVAWTATQARIAGECSLERSSFAGLIGATTVQDLKVDDAALAPLVRARGNGASVPWSATVTAGASPYTYTNADVTDEIVTITSGTVSSVQVSRDAGVTFVTVASATGCEVRLRHGDQVKVTYTVVPTITKARA